MDVWNSCFILVAVMTVGGFGQMVPHPVDPDLVVRLPESTRLRYAAPGPQHKSHATILFWTPCYDDRSKWFWWFRKSFVQDLCPDVVRRCDFTIDQSRLDESDAVVFMIYGQSFNLSADIPSQLPPRRKPQQRWIFHSIEPPTDIDILGNLSKLNHIFNWTMSYRHDSDVYAPFATVVLTQQPLATRTAAAVRDYAAEKSKMAAWFVSHCDTEGRREAFVAELRKHMDVDIYGRCGTLECLPPMSDECFDRIGREYRFYLSFENFLCKDYVTEKFTLALAADVVPVVFGGGDYSRHAPPGSYVDALSFADPAALAAYLIFLSENREEYNRFFDWKRGYDIRVVQHGIHVCNLCGKVLETGLPDRTYHDIEEWWRGKGQCHGWNAAANETNRG